MTVRDTIRDDLRDKASGAPAQLIEAIADAAYFLAEHDRIVRERRAPFDVYAEYLRLAPAAMKQLKRLDIGCDLQKTLAAAFIGSAFDFGRTILHEIEIEDMPQC